MKRSLLVGAFLLAILVMAAAGVVFGRAVCPSACGTAASAEAERVPQVEWLTRTLHLAPEQQAALGRIEAQYRGTLATQCAAHCAAKARLQGVLFRFPPDEATTSQLLATMAAAQTASERATLEHIRQVHSLLTPEQKRRFEAAVVGSVCGCRSGLHGCGMAGNGPSADRTSDGCGMADPGKRP